MTCAEEGKEAVVQRERPVCANYVTTVKLMYIVVQNPEPLLTGGDGILIFCVLFVGYG